MRPSHSLGLPVERTRRYTRVQFPAEIDISNAGHTADQLLRLLNTGTHILILDLSGTGFIGSSGINVVIRTERRASVLDARLGVIVHPESHVRRIFDLVGLSRVVLMAPDLDTAAAALGAGEDDGDDPARPAGPAGGTRRRRRGRSDTDPGGRRPMTFGDTVRGRGGTLRWLCAGAR